MAIGIFPNTHDLKEVRFPKTSAKFIRLRGLTDANGGNYMSVAELGVIQDLVTNQSPVALPQSLSTLEDTGVSVSLEGSDGDGDSLAYSVINQPANGTISGVPPNLTYTPSPNYNGNDSFTFVVNDGKEDSIAATISINVAPVNDAPVANANTATTSEDVPVAITLTGSDTDSSGLTYSIVSGPTKGTLSGTLPNLTYTPSADYNGSDSFTFRVNDGTADSTTATVSITVSARKRRVSTCCESSVRGLTSKTQSVATGWPP